MSPQTLRDAVDLARVAAPIYAQRSGAMRERDAMETSLQDALTLMGVAATILAKHDVRSADL